MTIVGHVDDAAITSKVKSRMVEDHAVDTTAIGVETQNGSVALSGYAKNALEKSTAESIAMKVKGVTAVQNNLVVRP
ncbi:MAG: BON domain-containing protein [Caldimonas sp.]